MQRYKLSAAAAPLVRCAALDPRRSARDRATAHAFPFAPPMATQGVPETDSDSHQRLSDVR
jgi:hypothetical protein